MRESTLNWVLDLSATCHICNSKELFLDLQPRAMPQKVNLSDDHTLEATSAGVGLDYSEELAMTNK